MLDKETIRFIISVSVLFLIGWVLLQGMLLFFQSFVGALILYTLFQPMNKRLYSKYKLPKTLSAVVTIIVIMALIIVPVMIIMTSLVDQANTAFNSISLLEKQYGNYVIPEIFTPGEVVTVKSLIREASGIGSNFLSRFILNTFSGAANVIAGVTLLFFLLYFMFYSDKKLPELAKSLLPFSKKNTDEFLTGFKDVTYATVISSGVIAVIQGVLITLAFGLAGLKNPIFWGFVGMFLSFLPIVGPPFIWVPATTLLFFSGQTGPAIIVLVIGIFLSTIDNFVRPILSKKFAKIHPVMTVIGVFIGLPLFGVIGLILGPLLLMYFFLALKIVKEDFKIRDGR